MFGIGAIGSVIAFELQKSQDSDDLSFYNRSPKSNIQLLTEGTPHTLPITLEIPPYKGMVDWLVVCMKEHQYNEALEGLSNLIGSQTKIAVVRNGLRLKEPLLKFTEEANVLECSIDCPVQPEGNGFYKVIRSPVISVPEGDLANQFAELFEKTTEIKKMKDFKSESWKKLCESSALGSILCLSGKTCSIFEDEKLRNLYSQLLREGILVARADGAQIEEDFETEMMSKLLSYPKTKGSSMLTDRKSGNPIELGAKNKAITAIGKQYEIDTPLNDAIVSILENLDTIGNDVNLIPEFERLAGLR